MGESWWRMDESQDLVAEGLVNGLQCREGLDRVNRFAFQGPGVVHCREVEVSGMVEAAWWIVALRSCQRLSVDGCLQGREFSR